MPVAKTGACRIRRGLANWFAAGYTSEKMLDAGKQIIDATMAAFPNQQLTLAVAGNGHAGATGNLDPDTDYVARNAVLAARATWPGRLIVQKNNLATFNHQRRAGTPYSSCFGIAGPISVARCSGIVSATRPTATTGVPEAISRSCTKSVDVAGPNAMNYI